MMITLSSYSKQCGEIAKPPMLTISLTQHGLGWLFWGQEQVPIHLGGMQMIYSNHGRWICLFGLDRCRLVLLTKCLSFHTDMSAGVRYGIAQAWWGHNETPKQDACVKEALLSNVKSLAIMQIRSVWQWTCRS